MRISRHGSDGEDNTIDYEALLAQAKADLYEKLHPELIEKLLADMKAELQEEMRQQTEQITTYINENLKTVSSHINEPFAVADETFGTQLWNWETQQYELRKSPATLYVPVGSKAKYLRVGGWTMFTKIEEDEGMGNGIVMPESSATDDGSWYNLQGTKVDHPRKGVFIKNGRKVVFK